jgi:GT2 family glycosyltransferase
LEYLSITHGGLPLLRYIPVSATQGPAGARNAGWRIADAPIIAFTDDDTIPDREWLHAGLQSMATGAEAAAGRIVMALPDKPTDYERDAGRLREAEFATANCFVQREALDMVGGFDERYSQAWREDSDLHFSLLRSGCRIAWAPQAVVVHPLRPAPFAAGLSMQRKVMFDVLLYRKFRDLYRQRIRKRPPWFYLLVTANLLAIPVALLAGWNTTAAWAAALWLALTLGFFARRISGTSWSLKNTTELLLTSMLIPPLSIFWRMVGIARFGWAMP